MSESGFDRPRRGFPQDTDSEEPTGADDTPVFTASAARRGRDPEADDAADDGGTGSTPAEPGSPTSANPFARPGSEAASLEVPAAGSFIPAPVMPVRDFSDFQNTGSGRRMSGIADGPAPEPRRSAASSATPPEPAIHNGATASAEPQSWVQHHKRALLLFVVGALVVALLLALAGFLASRRGGDATPTVPPTSPSASPSASVSAVPPVTAENLLTLEGADAIVPGASWAVASTAETREEATARAACLGSEPSDINPLSTFQRAIGTSEDNDLAALHQVDLYDTVEAAEQVQQERLQSLSECNEIQAHILSATAVTGLADEVTQLTVEYQEEQQKIHTVLLVRTGRALTLLDVTRNDKAVAVESAIAGIVPSLEDICDRVDGTCPTEPVVAPTVPPVAEPQGWLIRADLPRVRPGYGEWTVSEPGDITSKGMGCENLPLATEPGPVSRQQRTYQLLKDDTTPTTFGIDEMVFDFEDNASARAFTTKLIDSLVSCKDRNKTAEITDQGAVNGTGADGVAVSARVISIDQAISDDAAVKFQLVVAIADTRVSYLLASVTDDYLFTEKQQQQIALRVAERNSQG